MYNYELIDILLLMKNLKNPDPIHVAFQSIISFLSPLQAPGQEKQ